MPSKFDGRGRRTGWHLQPLMAVAFSSAIAVRYCLAAERDEKNGFPLTAAMEWRKAAELLTLVPLAADRCWRKWERIMRLPRRLAGPIGASAAGSSSSPDTRADAAATTPIHADPPLAAAA